MKAPESVTTTTMMIGQLACVVPLVWWQFSFVVVSHSVLRIISHPSSPSIYYRLFFYLSYLERSISASCTAHTYLHMQVPCGPNPPHPTSLVFPFSQTAAVI